MTPEKATYYRLMLLAGLREEFDQDLEQTLETADPIPDPELDLAFCMSDLDKTISVLNNYALMFSVDEAQVCEMVLTELRKQYLEQRLTSAQLVQIMYTIAQAQESWQDDPWDKLRYPFYDYELMEEGLLSQETFECAFRDFLLLDKHTDVWALEKEHQQKKKKSFWDFFRKRKGKEKFL